MPKEIADDEVVQFFRTAAAYNDQDKTWSIPVHGWIYEPQRSRFRKSLFAAALKAKYGLNVSDEHRSIYERRLNLLIADNERGKEIEVKLADKHYVLPPSAANGHFQTQLILDSNTVAKHRQGAFLHFSTTTLDGRQFHGHVGLIPAHGLSVISDIDDTIKVSDVLNHQRLINNTFYKPFAVVQGMNAAYQQLSSPTTAFHFVSSSPWQLYAPLEEFVDREAFPWATFSLKPIRFRDMTLFDLFKPGTATKPQQIHALVQQFPSRKFILIGDSGEQDPEVYAKIAQQYPHNIVKIFIRNITSEDINNARFQKIVVDQQKWALFTNPGSIRF